MNRILCCLICFLGAGLAVSAPVRAGEPLSLLAKGKYFDIYAPRGVSAAQAVKRLNYDFGPHPDILLSRPAPDPEGILSQAVDTIYLEVCDILDIHIYDLRGRINIYPDQDSLSSIAGEVVADPSVRTSFAIPEHEAIYLTMEDLSPGLLGHEIAHLLMDRYFVVSPSTKIQEILSGYVEYSLLKTAGRLSASP